MISGYTFLVWKDTGDEVVLDIVAFIADCDLPPVTKKKRYSNVDTLDVSMVDGATS
jgi:hypothetical protein